MTNPNDYKDLCARMADELDHYRQLLMDDRREIHALAAEARAVIAADCAQPVRQVTSVKAFQHKPSFEWTPPPLNYTPPVPPQPEPEGLADEDVEGVAKYIYDAMRFRRVEETPEWEILGNSDAQEVARRTARAILTCGGSPHTSALGELDDGEPAARVHVSDFRGLENTAFELTADLAPGSYDLLLSPLSTPPSESAEPTDEKLLRMAATEIGYEFTGSWFLTGRNSPNLEVTPLELLNLMRAVLARWSNSTPQLPITPESVLAQREEILAAFIAKHGFDPDSAIQVEQRQEDGTTTWRIERIPPAPSR